MRGEVGTSGGTAWLGDIPKHWERRRLKYIVDFCGGGTPSKDVAEFWSGDIPWVSPKDMRTGVILDSEDHITEQALRASATRMVPAGSVLIVVRSGILRHTIPVAIAGRPVTLNQDMKALIPGRDVESTYLRYVIQGRQQILLSAWTKTGATVQSIEHELLANTVFPVPPISVQRAITDFLDEKTTAIDALIAKKERLVELIEEKRQATITRAVTKGLDPDVPMKDAGVEWLGEVPEHWEVRRLKHAIHFVTSGSRGWAEYYSDTGAFFFRIGNLRRGSLQLDLSDIQHVDPPMDAEGERTRVQAADVLFSITAYIGSVGLVEDGIPTAYVNQHIALVRPDMSVVEPTWIGYSFLSDSGQISLQFPVYGGTKEGLGLDDVKNLPLPLPPIDEQRAITNHLAQLDAKGHALVTRLRKQIDRLREYRQTLISAAVTGQLELRVRTTRAPAPTPAPLEEALT